MRRLRSTHGLTLVEVILVLTVISILAAVAVPKFLNTSAEARAATRDASLVMLRKAVDRYYHEHGHYPGARRHTDGAAVADSAEAAQAFTHQLTRYSTTAGVTSNDAGSAFRHGPYLKDGIPVNPYNGERDVTCDITTADIMSLTTDAADRTGWKFYVRTGIVLANDRTSSDGSAGHVGGRDLLDDVEDIEVPQLPIIG